MTSDHSMPKSNKSQLIQSCVLVAKLRLTLRLHGLQSTRLLCPRDLQCTSGRHALLQGISPTLGLRNAGRFFYHLSHHGAHLTVFKAFSHGCPFNASANSSFIPKNNPVQEREALELLLPWEVSQYHRGSSGSQGNRSQLVLTSG